MADLQFIDANPISQGYRQGMAYYDQSARTNAALDSQRLANDVSAAEAPSRLRLVTTQADVAARTAPYQIAQAQTAAETGVEGLRHARATNPIAEASAQENLTNDQLTHPLYRDQLEAQIAQSRANTANISAQRGDAGFHQSMEALSKGDVEGAKAIAARYGQAIPDAVIQNSNLRAGMVNLWTNAQHLYPNSPEKQQQYVMAGTKGLRDGSVAPTTGGMEMTGIPQPDQFKTNLHNFSVVPTKDENGNAIYGRFNAMTGDITPLDAAYVPKGSAGANRFQQTTMMDAGGKPVLGTLDRQTGAFTPSDQAAVPKGGAGALSRFQKVTMTGPDGSPVLGTLDKQTGTFTPSDQAVAPNPVAPMFKPVQTVGPDGKPVISAFDARTGNVAAGNQVAAPKAGGSGATGQTERIIAQLRAENPGMTLQEALALTKRAPNGDVTTLRLESLALGAAKADMKYMSDPTGTLEKWRTKYGLSKDMPSVQTQGGPRVQGIRSITTAPQPPAAPPVVQPVAPPAAPPAPPVAPPPPIAAPAAAPIQEEDLIRARDAISKGAPRDQVIERLRQSGIDPTGL